MRTHVPLSRAPTPRDHRSSGRGAPGRKSPDVRRILHAPRLQPKLTVGAPDDAFEREADQTADRVMRMPEPEIDTAGAPPRIQRMCAECEEEKEKQGVMQRKCAGCEEEMRAKEEPGQTPEAPSGFAQRLAALQGDGRPLPAAERSFFEPRFGHDFANVRLHSGPAASELASSVHARAFTLGRSIVFGEGQYTPGTSDGRRLMAHELTHVVQQRGGGESIQRENTTLVGREGVCVEPLKRELTTGSGPALPKSSTPGGTIVPGTEGPHQNCAGMSLCGRKEYINWPFLGIEAADGIARPPQITASWDKARYFVPSGCGEVNCSGVSVNATRCKPEEREIIVFLYRWPVGVLKGTSTVVYQSDFHMIGRTPSSLPMAWESKMDRREKVIDIRDPWQSLYDAYPHTKQKDRTIQQLCFCCDCGKVKTRAS
ncbi:MAG TPA: DUF4157 domain-containing protein [Thermoanaerobaculia bacterium]|jgi:hypothetical protein|nr:DUF4157 domain-containing protein [Thermoanaerobaculia bacterium]